MASGNRKRGPMDHYVKKHEYDPPLAYESKGSSSSQPLRPSVQISGFVSNLWETAVAKTKKRLPVEISDAHPQDILQAVCSEAEAREDEVERKQWKVKVPGKNGKEVKLRDIYGVIVSSAQRFRDVGDIAIQADPGHAAIPWAIVRFCLTAAINKHEMYGIMMQGLETVTNLITHYIVIERVFVDEDDDNARAVKNSLLALYTAILDFLLAARDYFPPLHPSDDDKHWFRHKVASGAGRVKSTFKCLDGSVHASVKDLLTKVSNTKNNVDADANHAYATMNIQVLDGFGKTQKQILRQLEDSGFALEEQDRRLRVILKEFQAPVDLLDGKLSEMYEQMESSQNQAQLRRVLDWLSPAAHESKRKTYHASLSSSHHRLPSSGRWFLEDPEYLRWQNSSDSSAAWLSGTSGTGKTTLLSIVIDHLQDWISKEASTDHLAFFYASAKEANFWADPDEVIRNIARQLSTTQIGASLEPATKQKYEELTTGTSEPPRLTMSECVDLVTALTSASPVIIVIDALDELRSKNSSEQTQSSRDDLIESLGEIMKKSSSPVKILMSTLTDSPTEARLRKVFVAGESNCSGKWHIIEANSSRNAEDISHFIDAELAQKIEKRYLLDGDVDPELRATIKSRLLERSDGMFRYASMQIDRLCDDRMDRITVLEELEKPLPGITSLYDQSIDEIRRESIDRVRITAQNTLKWLLCVQETLPAGAFLEAISSEGGIDQPKASNLHSACRMLVVTDHYTDVFTFNHPSVREHLAGKPEYSSSDCHLTAADRCLRMMVSAASSISRLNPSQVKFYWYAKIFWPLHYQSIDFNINAKDKSLNEERQRGFVRVKGLLKKFLMQGHKTSQAFNEWKSQVPKFVKELGEQHPLSKQLSSLEASLETPLHVICVFGFAELIEAHHKHFDFNQRNAHGQTALCLAVENNQLETVRSLLAHGRVDVNEFNVNSVIQMQQQEFSPNICYANAVQAAAVQGSRAMLEVLIDSGARLNLVAGYYGSALQAACCKGHRDLVEFLLKHDLDPNTEGGFHGNSLQAASSDANLDIVNILLNAGACETTPGGHYGSVLMAATCSGSKEVIDALLAHTGDVESLVNVKTEKYGTPLQTAADMNRADIVGLLVQNRADINALGESQNQATWTNHSSALDIAAWGGHHKIVSILCRLGAEADISASENKFHLLHQSALRNILELAEYCVKESCDVNMTTDKGPRYHDEQRIKTPLAFACAEGHLEMVELLLRSGALIEYPGDDITTLQVASIRGHCNIIEVLIKEHQFRHQNQHQSTLRFIDRHTPRHYDTALMEAIRAGSLNAVSTLLSHGATFALAKDGIGPLHRATDIANPRIMDLLIEHMEKSLDLDSSLEINRRNSFGKTPLIDAAERNHTRIVELLLQHGGDPAIRDKDGHSALHYAAWRNHQESVKLLLQAWEKEELEKRMTLVNVKNIYGNTALQESLDREYFQIVKMLLAAGAKLEPSPYQHHFIRVTRQKNIEVFRQAIEAFEGHPEALSMYLNHRNGGDGYSLLHDAASQDRLDAAQLVLEHGADATTMDAEYMIDPKKVDCKTALHVAAREGRTPLVELLLRTATEQCDKAQMTRFINRQSSHGKTALMDAAETNRPEIMKLLLSREYGADWSLTDNCSFNALHFCAFRGHMQCVEILIQIASGADKSPVGQQRFKAFLNQQSVPDGKTPMHDVTASGHKDIAKLLLYTYHAEYEIYDKNSDSILHRAVQYGQEHRVFRLYLDYMSQDPDQEKFKRVLHHKNASSKRHVLTAEIARNRPEWAKLLKEYGAYE